MKAIFEEGIATGQATFETKAPSWEHWDGAHFGGLVAVEDAEVVGWTALTPYSSRPCLRGRRRGERLRRGPRSWPRRGPRRCSNALIERSERTGIWTLQAGDLPREQSQRRPSISAAGSALSACASASDALNGDWRDVLLLERRSEVIR